LRHVGELEEEVTLWKDLGAGEVIFGVDPEAELSFLPAVLEAFVPAYPGVRVTIRSGNTDALLPALFRRELHFLVADAEIALDHDGFEIRAIAADPIAAAIRPSHPLLCKRKPAPADVAACPFVGASTAPRFERWTVDQGREHGGPFAPSLVRDNYEVLVRLAESSDAIVFGPRNVLAGYERAGRLKVMPWPIDGPDIQTSLIRSKGRHLSPSAERLIALFAGQGTS